jgi:hypothetical protein
MVPIPFNVIRSGILAVALAASVGTVGLIYIDSAEARINGPRNTQKAQICGFIQDAYDQDTADLDSAIDTDEYVAILNDRDMWANEWKIQGCDSLYGPLFTPAPVSPLHSAPLTGGPTRR